MHYLNGACPSSIRCLVHICVYEVGSLKRACWRLATSIGLFGRHSSGVAVVTDKSQCDCFIVIQLINNDRVATHSISL